MEEEDVSLNGNKLIMFVKPNETFERRNELLERWFRNKLEKRQNLLSKGGNKTFCKTEYSPCPTHENKMGKL